MPSDNLGVARRPTNLPMNNPLRDSWRDPSGVAGNRVRSHALIPLATRFRFGLFGQGVQDRLTCSA